MSDDDTDRDPLEELAAEFMERQRRGESPSIAEYTANHPDLAREIREFFPTILAIEQLKARDRSSAGGLACPGFVQPERLGDFRIIREIGRGGMGIVYEAEQQSLGRRVAVKVLPGQSLLGAKHLARFRREARIAARLHHTNIVQVFGVGEQDGLHYYVMQYVPGVGLDRIISHLARICAGQQAEAAQNGQQAPDDNARIDSLCRQWLGMDIYGGESSAPATAGSIQRPGQSKYFRIVARLGIQVAEALDYAHSHGTFHRDVKPGNLLVDHQGALWVTDFGLAQATYADSVTQTGDITGTLRYMPPERFGGRVDARGDIYSLGLTLYELLVLQPAFADSDRSRLIRQITSGQPLRPAKINPHIPRDLETIILKATEHESARRYATAAALAGDLQRFLEDRPIEARPVRAAERLWRWSRRNPAIAALAGISLALLLAVAIVANVGYFSTKRALKGEAQQRQRAEATASLAQEALDRLVERLSPAITSQTLQLKINGTSQTSVEIAAPPILSKETASLLGEMLPFYDRLAQQVGDDVPLRLRAADANRRLADIRQRLGQYEQAHAAYSKAIAMYQELSSRVAEDEHIKIRIAGVYNELGRLYRSTQQFDSARESHLHVLSIVGDGSSGGRPARPEARYELAQAYYRLGTWIPEQAGPPPPRPPPDGGSPAHRTPGDDLHDDGPPGHGLSLDRGPYSPVAGFLPLLPPPPPGPGFDGPWQQPGERQEYLNKAIDLFAGLAEQSPANPLYRRMLALCYRDGYPDAIRRDRTKAAESLDRGTRILEQLVRDFPQVPDYRFDLCQSYAMIGMGPHGLPAKDVPAAETRLRKALTLSEALTAEYPQAAEYLSSQAQIHHRLGAILQQMGHRDQAEQAERAALACQQKLVAQAPDVVSFRIWLSAYRTSLVDMLLQVGKTDEAKDQGQQAIDMLGDLLAAHPEMWYLHGPLMDAYETLAGILRQMGQNEPATAATAQARQHRRLLEEHLPPWPPGHRTSLMLPGMYDVTRPYDSQFSPWIPFAFVPDTQPGTIYRSPGRSVEDRE
jgi:eukaryotic-like serine/threonine-protein kinase